MSERIKTKVNDVAFILQFAIDDFKGKYAGSVLGMLWAFLQPVITITLYWFVFQFGFRQKQFRKQLDEVKSLPYYATSLEKVEDGIYQNKTETSFLNLSLQVEIENHHYKNIEILETNGSKGKNIPKFIEKILSGEEIKTPSKKNEMLEYLVFLSCLDGAVGKNLKE